MQDTWDCCPPNWKLPKVAVPCEKQISYKLTVSGDQSGVLGDAVGNPQPDMFGSKPATK